ncbi:MAG: excinuclease ABC subunit UvrB [Candidatus Sungbacteria bacterium]|uniref:UvrABC system protein B n=1 Tax=Candidatus Sungiibacteriota bacterium TaxID=2750080 RepID=A0A9D6HU38_9BACT|nr:excinuclease ABC subunit UvrB [Candidatus Sungbacteria bacterium]
MPQFKLVSKFRPTGDQPAAIEKLTAGFLSGARYQTLLGVTGSGKTFTLANVINNVQKPTLVISHNKTLAWQLYQEFKDFFPQNEVHYFVSYYDYYQPEAYIPQTDTYIEKDAKINETIDKLRHAATQAVLTRPDTIIVSSVSCIYNIGDPEEYQKIAVELKTGGAMSRRDLTRRLILMQFNRNNYSNLPGTFRLKGETLEIDLPTGEEMIRITFSGAAIEKIWSSQKGVADSLTLFPAKHFVTEETKLKIALANIEAELAEELKKLKKEGKILEAARLEQRTHYDLEMLAEAGYCSGIENYSRHLSFREPGSSPFSLTDFFLARRSFSEGGERSPAGPDFLTLVDESHMTVSQIRGMYNGDRARKTTLVEHGFRLPSSLDNRPLMFKEWEEKTGQTIFSSATPNEYELEKSKDGYKTYLAEQLIRPTHILDPQVEVRPTENQIRNAIKEIKSRIERGQRTLVTVITKRLAEDLAEHLAKAGIKAAYLHSEIKTLNRPEILNDLRSGKIDVLVGVNLLREGLDLPEVALILIFDADKEGFLRNETTMIQTIGRAARHTDGRVIMYADKITGSMKAAIRETKRRRNYQDEFNKKNKLKPKTIIKEVKIKETVPEPEKIWLKTKTKRELERELKTAIADWDFEKAILIRDYLKTVK